MPEGVSLSVAQAWLNVLRGTTFTGLAGLFIKLHIGAPGAAGTANPSALTTRNALTLSAPDANGVCSLVSLGSYLMTATEEISHITAWDTVGPAGGLFVGSGVLSVPKPVNGGDTLTFDTLTAAIGPIAG